MGRFAKPETVVFEEPEDDYDPSECVCDQCGRKFNGSDSGGGHCAACHQSFRSLGGFDKHRTGRYQPNERRCLTPDEMTARGWVQGDSGMWRMPPPKNSPWEGK
jgi:hypothetical protein